MSTRIACNVKKIDGSRDGNGVNITTTTRTIFIIFIVGFVSGITTVYALKAGGIVASIGTAQNKDAFGIGSWFRYDYDLPIGNSKYYVLTNITGITTAGSPTWGDLVASSILGSDTRWYKWSIDVYNKETSVKVPFSVYKATPDWEYHLKYIIEGYGNRSVISVDNMVKTDRYHTTRPMFALVGGSSTPPFLQRGSGGIFSYISGGTGYQYASRSAYDYSTYILLWMVCYYDYTSYYFALTAFSINNPMAVEATPTPEPVFDLVTPIVAGGATSTGKRVVILNYDQMTVYRMVVTSTNQSVIKNNDGINCVDINFGADSYDLNVLKPGTTMLTIRMYASKQINVGTGAYFQTSEIVTTTFSCDTRPSIPSTMTSVPSQPLLSVSPVTSTNGTMFLSWTASGNSPSYYELYFKKGSNFINENDATLLATISATQPREFTYTEMTNGGYYFGIIAVNENGRSPLSAVALSNVLITFPPTFSPPATPTLSVPTVVNGDYNSNVSLSWTSSTGASSYKIYRRINETFTDKKYAVFIGEIAGTTRDDTLEPMYQQTVYYAVSAVNSTGESSISSVRSIVVTVNTTYAPTMTIVKTGDTVVSWSPVSFALEYIMYVFNGTTFHKINAGLETSYNFTGFLPNGDWNVTATVKTSIDDYESNKSNSVLISIADAVVIDLDYGSVPAPYNADLIVLLVIIITGAAAIFLVVASRRKTMFKKR